MEQRLKNRIEPQLTSLIERIWEDFYTKEKLGDIGISHDTLLALKDRIQIAYQDGRNDYHEEIKDIYLNNIEHFEDMFDPDEDEDETMKTKNY